LRASGEENQAAEDQDRDEDRDSHAMGYAPGFLKKVALRDYRHSRGITCTIPIFISGSYRGEEEQYSLCNTCIQEEKCREFFVSSRFKPRARVKSILRENKNDSFRNRLDA
jgi:hypothetical protein